MTENKEKYHGEKSLFAKFKKLSKNGAVLLGVAIVMVIAVAIMFASTGNTTISVLTSLKEVFGSAELPAA